MALPKLPEKPAELLELEQRRADLRRQRRDLQAQLAPVEQELQRLARGDADDLEDLAEQLADGTITSVGRDDLPEQRDILRGRLDLVTRGERKVAERLDHARDHYANQIAKAVRPAHKAAVQRIARALSDLVAANEQERQLLQSVPGVRLVPHAFPGVGRFGCQSDPVQRWFDYAKSNRYLEEPEVETPKRRSIARRLVGGDRNSQAPAPMLAKGGAND